MQTDREIAIALIADAAARAGECIADYPEDKLEAAIAVLLFTRTAIETVKNGGGFRVAVELHNASRLKQ